MSQHHTPEAGTVRHVTGSRTGPRSWRRIATLVAGAIIALAGIGAGCGAASASTATYRVGQFSCSYGSSLNPGRNVSVYPPTMTGTTGSTLQNVYWDAYLYRWNGSSWQFYKASGWNNAAATGVGVVPGSWVNSAGMNITFYQFHQLPAGYYEVYNYLQWGPGAASAQAWSPDGQYYDCVFSS